jgi:Tol biopolymer transport system component
LHPRFSRDGRSVTIDSPHLGGRQIYLIDIRGIVG